MKIVGCLLAILLVVAAYLWIAAGYWENLPLLDRISGPMRFRQFVADPVPHFIHTIRGGYSGFPQGQVKTFFLFSKPPSDWPFLGQWTPTSPTCLEELRPWITEIHEFEAYQRPLDSTPRSCHDSLYLVIDLKAQRGILFLE